MSKVRVLVGIGIGMRILCEPIAQALAVIPITCIHRKRTSPIGICVEKSPKSIPLLDGVALFQVRKSKSSSESRHVANRLVTRKQFSLVIGQGCLIKIRMSER